MTLTTMMTLNHQCCSNETGLDVIGERPDHHPKYQELLSAVKAAHVGVDLVNRSGCDSLTNKSGVERVKLVTTGVGGVVADDTDRQLRDH